MDRRRIEWIDYARLAAALSVLVFHYTVNDFRNGTFTVADFGWLSRIGRYGYLGVDFFFIVSGFVISFSAQAQSADRFVVGRMVRLLPAFLFCMTLTFALRAAAGDPLGLAAYVANLTMVPQHLGFPPVDGVYWSLAYELVFYAAIFLVLAARQLARLRALVFAWLMIAGALALAGVNSIFFGGYFSLFAGGVMLFFVLRDGASAANTLGLLAAAALAIHGAALRSVGAGTDPAVVALAVATFFAVFLLLNRPGLVRARLPASALMGGVSYPLYLLHDQIGRLVMGPRLSEADKWVLLAGTTILVVAASACVHLVVERWPRRLWRRVFDHLAGDPLRLVLAPRGVREEATPPA